MRMRRVGTVVGALMTALLLLGLAAPEASAHAALLKTTPQDSQILDTQPTEVTLTYGEAVTIGLGQLKVVTADGDRVDTGVPTQSAGGTEVHIPLKSGLAQGSYLVIWRVVSADSHPVSGAFTFSVGKESGDLKDRLGRGNLTSLTAAPRAPSIALGTTRFFGFSALLVFLGGAIFCLLLWPAGVPRIRGMLLGAAVVESVMAALALFLEGPYAAGEGLSNTFDSRLLSSVSSTKYGEATGTRIVIAAVAALAVLVVGKRASKASAGLLAAMGLFMAMTWSAAGHAGVGDWEPWTDLLDTTHLVFVSAWVGGLVVLVRGLRSWTEDEQAALLPGWSRLAASSVALLVATGVFATLREVREIGALFSTKYGIYLVVKYALVGLMLLFALVGRSFVRSHYTHPPAAGEEDSESTVATLRRSVGIEASLAVVVVAVTALLVNTVPAKDAFAPPYTGKSAAGPYTVAVDIYPARKGVNGLHVYTVLTSSGLTKDVAEVSGYIQKKGSSDRITVNPPLKSTGHYEDLDVVLPGKGSYVIDLQIRANDLDSYETKQTFEVK
ncbi:MAG: copper resistance protein CopC [Frankiales bacterium]|nr:copper resistance protein CopC [Frankiales bacterium]